MKTLIAAAAVLALAAPVAAKPESAIPAGQPTVYKPSTELVDGTSFEVFFGDKDGPACQVTFKKDSLDVCGTTVPRDASTEYQHSNRTPMGSCNMFGWCIKVQHRFAFSWRPEGQRRQQVAVFLRNNKRAEQFDAAVAEWLDVLPSDMCERPNPIPGCR
jgi:hypothetical protein